MKHGMEATTFFGPRRSRDSDRGVHQDQAVPQPWFKPLLLRGTLGTAIGTRADSSPAAEIALSKDRVIPNTGRIYTRHGGLPPPTSPATRSRCSRLTLLALSSKAEARGGLASPEGLSRRLDTLTLHKRVHAEHPHFFIYPVRFRPSGTSWCNRSKIECRILIERILWRPRRT